VLPLFGVIRTDSSYVLRRMLKWNAVFCET